MYSMDTREIVSAVRRAAINCLPEILRPSLFQVVRGQRSKAYELQSLWKWRKSLNNGNEHFVQEKI